MNNTALGLICAITLLLAHMFLETQTTNIVDSLEVASMKFLNSLTERRPDVETPPAPAPRASVQGARA
jgi:biopolymer transport protein ExbB/TolQ